MTCPAEVAGAAASSQHQGGAWPSGLLAVQVTVAVAYDSVGSWWHRLLHQLVGWGAGLGTAALIGATPRYPMRTVLALLLGQLVSITPDLQFCYARMPHEPSMGVCGWGTSTSTPTRRRSSWRSTHLCAGRLRVAGAAGAGDAGGVPGRQATDGRSAFTVTSARLRPTLGGHWKGGDPRLE